MKHNNIAFLVIGEKMEVEDVEEQEKEQLLEEEMMEESGETTDTSSEKANESKDYFDEDEIFQCLECKTKECAMWRKSNDKQGIFRFFFVFSQCLEW